MTNTFKRLLQKIRRRQVLPVMFTYLAISWFLIQAAAIVVPALLLPQWTVRVIVITVIAGFPIVGVFAWFFNFTTEGIKRTSELPEKESTESAAADPPEELPPTEGAIAAVTVLPFESLSADPADDILAEGLATEIHSTLGQMHQIRLASRRSAFRFRDNTQSMEKIAKKLGVRYIVSGNVMHSGDQIRVIAELDDAVTGSQIWSQKFSRTVDDLFTIQSEIAEAIVGAFGIERERTEMARAQERPTDSLDAWNLLQKARNYINDYSESSLATAKSLLERCLELDEDYAAAHAALASVLIEQILNGYSKDMHTDRESALQSVAKARSLSPQDPFVLKMAGMVLAVCGHINESLHVLRVCVKQAPFDFGAWGYFGWPLTARAEEKDLEELQQIVNRLLQTAPEHPGVAYWLYHQSVASALQGEYAGAARLMKDAAARHRPIPWAHMHIANVNGLLDNASDAKKAAAQATTLNPEMTAEHYAECIHAMTGNEVIAGKRLAGLVAAGLLPE